jgi:cell wall-associated NlpC family hydrolase
MDCYTAIRKWYYQKRNIVLPNFPRDNEWWLNKNLYLENFEKAGFKEINIEAISDGDVMLGCVNSDIINHGGIYLDNLEDGKGLLYHHLPNRLSRREPANPWLIRAKVILKYAN